ncbi:MAG: glycoside hydrolase family 95 protein [Clostridiales bacterium]|nr:glycoside hydrolase family 95 protein [Clostridiales bacterium]
MYGRNVLWYRRGAEKWVEALPIGNGRIGAMVFGGVEEERIALNEDSLWSGYPRDTNVPNSAAYFRAAQRMVLSGQYGMAQAFIEDHMLGPYTQSYLPLCDLFLAFEGGEARDYRRSLSLDDALCVTEYRLGGVRYRREAFVSHPAQAMYLRIDADKPGAVSFELSIGCQLRASVEAGGNRLTLRGVAPSMVRPNYVREENAVRYAEDDAEKGMRFIAVVDVEAEGCSVIAQGDRLAVANADAVTLRLAARTSFAGYDRQPYVNGRDEAADCERDLAAAAVRYEDAKSAHLADHRSLMARVSLDLRDEKYLDQSTDERLKNFAAQQDDRQLCELMFQYGRYLLIACSRPGTQPANLQGIWNEELRAPWSGNYTVNINTQMNYWPAEAVNLSELHRPLIEMVGELRDTGGRTAKVHYGTGGACAHHNVDLWRLSNPVGEGRRGTAGYAFWPMSFGWLCQHLFEHYQYTGDAAFLKDRALPALRDAARFFLDIMVRDGQGRLIVTPATSPENRFLLDGEEHHVSQSAAMSGAIVREVLGNYLSALDALGEDEPMAAEAAAALPGVCPYEIGSAGQLLEWEREFDEPEPHHRHTSHLYGLHPGHEISPDATPELAEACRRTLARRGDDGTGWSLGWKINFWARLRDGDHALKLIKRQLRFVEGGEVNYRGGGGTYMNLFDAHPPFQIDGNFGACAGIAELFVQCRGDRVYLLPALPAEWADGEVKGLRAYGGLEIDLAFAGGRLTRAKITRVADCDWPMTLVWAGNERAIAPQPGQSIEIG